VTPVLTVADVRLAVAWYIEVFGFVEHVRIGEGHRSQLGLPDGPPASWSWQRCVRDGEHRSGNDPTR
jgi:hypothetical protein